MLSHGLEPRDPVWFWCCSSHCWWALLASEVGCLGSECSLYTSVGLWRPPRSPARAAEGLWPRRKQCRATKWTAPALWQLSTFCTRGALPEDLMILPWFPFENPEEPVKFSQLCWCLYWHGSCVHFLNKLSKHCGPQKMSFVVCNVAIWE